MNPSIHAIAALVKKLSDHTHVCDWIGAAHVSAKHAAEIPRLILDLAHACLHRGKHPVAPVSAHHATTLTGEGVCQEASLVCGCAGQVCQEPQRSLH